MGEGKSKNSTKNRKLPKLIVKPQINKQIANENDASRK